MLLTCKGRDYAAQQIRYLRELFPEVSARHTNIKFPGRGQRQTPIGDIYAIVELIMLLPGRRAGLVRSDAARRWGTWGEPTLAIARPAPSRRLTSTTHKPLPMMGRSGGGAPRSCTRLRQLWVSWRV